MRKLIIILLACIPLLCQGQFSLIVDSKFEVSAGIPTDSLVGYYPFNGNANDQSGNGYDGIVTGATLDTNRFGDTNDSYYFDGTDDFIELQDGTGFSLDSFCLSLWVKYEVSGVTNYTFFKRDASGDLYAIFKNNSDNLEGRYNSQSTNTFPNSFTIDSWVHVAYQVTSDSIHVYFDNTRVESRLLSASGIDVTTNAIVGDISTSGSNLEMQGNIDDIRIYSRPLTEDEINQLYTEGGWPNP